MNISNRLSFSARGDYVADSDYDFLAVVDEVSPKIKEIVDEIAGEFLFQYDAVFSIFSISEEKYRNKMYEPFLRNICKEGMEVKSKHRQILSWYGGIVAKLET